MNFTVQHIARLSSTNSFLAQNANIARLDEGYTVFTDEQTAGRGQFSNRWESEGGKNILLSILLRPDFLNISDHFYLSIAFSVAVVSLLEEYNINAKIKWPNDIYVNEQKIAGLLIENQLQRDQLKYSILGLGLNVNQTVFPKELPNPVSMKLLLGEQFCIEKVLQDFLGKLEIQYDYLRTGNYHDYFLNIYYKYLYRFHQKRTYKDEHGVFEGTIVGIGSYGRLFIKDSNGNIRKYQFKEVKFL